MCYEWTSPQMVFFVVFSKKAFPKLADCFMDGFYTFHLNLHGWSTNPHLTHHPQKPGFNKALLRETNG